MIIHVVFLPVCQKGKLIQSDEHVFHFWVAKKNTKSLLGGSSHLVSG